MFRFPKRFETPRFGEILLWAVGALFITAFVFLRWQHEALAQDAVENFYSEKQDATSSAEFSSTATNAISNVDQGLWSQSRIRSFTSADRHAYSVLAVIRIARLSLEAPVFEGAEESELDRGPGWIRGTAQLGRDGNVGIAGHRDGFFRALKDVQLGDIIEIVSLDTNAKYRVSDIWVVEPDAVHVLDATDVPSVTLVTCYPFYFIGHAPQRFIVRAELLGSA